ncbi:MAG: class II glutamine amidotransferase, partial [Actinomycetaceae bacterium]|nr:class II glutamine amidotransferase [Actinomycetaceae bacterium]
LSARNTHPFVVDFGDHHVVMIHNGMLFDTYTLANYQHNCCGDTDSELIAMHIADVWSACSIEHRGNLLARALADLSRGNIDNCPQGAPPSLVELVRTKGRGLNKVNVICDDGIYLYAHTNTVEPTLYMCEKQGQVSLSTTPLDEDEWCPLERGRVYIWNKGKRVWVSGAHDFLFEETHETTREALCSIK